MTSKVVAKAEAVFRAPSAHTALPQASRVESNQGIGQHRRVPLMIPADEAYYWSRPWQDDVLTSMEALRAGEFVDFDSDDPNDVARWLLSVDEDDCD